MIAIDITDGEIRAIRATNFNGEVKALEHCTVPLEKGCIQNGHIMQNLAVKTQLLKLLAHFPKKRPRILITIHTSAVLLRELSVPKPRYKVNRAFYTSMILAHLDFQPQCCISYAKLNEETIYAGVCSEELVEEYIQLCQSLPVRLEGLYLGAGCMERLLRGSGEYDSLMPFVAVQNDRNLMGMTIIGKDEPGVSTHTTRTDEKTAQYHHLMHFCENRFPRGLFYYGGFENALKETGDQLGLSVLPLKPPRWLQWDKKDSFYPYAFCTAALWCHYENMGTLNLLQTTQFQKQDNTKRFLYSLLIHIAFGCLVIGIIRGLYQLQFWEYNQKEALITEQNNVIHTQVVEVKEAQNQLDLLQAQGIKIKLVDLMYHYLPKGNAFVLQTIQGEMEEGMELVGEFRLQNQHISITLHCTHDQQPARFVQNLINTGVFEQVQYNGYQKIEGEKGYQFHVTMFIKGGNVLETDD